MRRTTWLVFGVMLLVLAGLALRGLPAGAQQPEQVYTLDWWTVDGGGATFSTGGGYSLGGTAGQPDAGVLTGGGYTLGGGFWKGGLPTGAYRIYLPLVMRNG
jgi:hypothetical protein